MKRFTMISAIFMLMLFLSTGALYAQSNNFDGDTLGQPYGTTSWSAGDAVATVDSLVIDTLTYSNVLKVEVNNYNAAPYLAFNIPGGLTLADYDTLSFSGYFASGDVGYKDIKAVVSSDSMSGPFGDNSGENDLLGSVTRSMGVSTDWEEIRIGIDNDRDSLSGTVYIAFGISAADSANDEATVWYADNVTLEATPIELESGPISKWAKDPSYGSWPILNTASSTAGNGSMGDATSIPSGSWASIRGAFAPVTAGSGAGNAFVITGKMEINGSLGSGYTPIRYALTNRDLGTIANENTEDASWVAGGSASGYSFMPVSGAGTMANGGGGSGTAWTINSGSWISTYGNNGGPISAAVQVPQLSEIVAGTYDWGMSVEAITDTTNEIRWYLVHENGEYWFGGSTVAQATTTTFNSVTFGFQGFDEVDAFTQVDITEAEATNGDPITVPTPPFDSHFITQWGADASYMGWPIITDTTDLAGDASMGAETTIESGAWASLRGAFDYDVEAEEGSALIVTGEMEIVGASLGSGYTPIRYALTYYEEPGTLTDAYTDSARWIDPSSSSGYSFMPVSGAGTLANGGGGAGTNWTLNNGSWLSTYGNNGAPIGTFYQIPALAEMEAGVYEFGISVEPAGELTNEIRWYLVHEEDEYFYAGSIIDTATTRTFNSINFGFQGSEGFTGVNLIEVEVDKGEPFDLPTPAFFDHFLAIERFGFIGDKFGEDWTLTPGEFTGNTSISGTAGSDVAAIRAGFDVPSIPTDQALVIEGNVTFEGGGFDEAGSFKFGVFGTSNPGSVDSTETNGYTWNGGEDGHSGYLFTAGAGIDGIVDGVWHDASGDGAYSVQANAATGTPAAGTYGFAVSIQSTSEGTDIRYTLTSEDGYVFEAAAVDAQGSVSSFDGINFAISNSTTTGMSISDLEITQGDAITVSNDLVDSSLPKSFALKQNYPNPFNPTTNINFDLPQAADVQLTVFNMLGQKVMTLVNSRMQAGAHKVTFDAQSLASGMYVYRIEAGSFVSTKKMMLIK